MFKKISFRKKIFLYTFVIFIIYSVLVLILQYEREKDFKKRSLETKLDDITEFAHKYIENKNLEKTTQFQQLDSLKNYIPIHNIRITVISKDGKVLYDSEVNNYNTMENHLLRPEIKKSTHKKFATDIRKSSTTEHSYYYYAKDYNNFYIRTAALYNVEIKDFLKAEKLFILYLILLFSFTAILLLFLTRNLGQTITKLKDFTTNLSTGKNLEQEVSFPNGELGDISKQIVQVYNKLDKTKRKISVSNNKLFGHLQALNEGIAFFDKHKNHILSNANFIQFLNLISDKPNISSEYIFEISKLVEIRNFIDNQLNNNGFKELETLPNLKTNIYKDGKYFDIQSIFFKDKSFEIIIKDITKLEKRKLIKQQMTSNIAHELKTPVATIMGYLETIERNKMSPEKQEYFIKKAFGQAVRLSDLIEDLSTLNKIEESKELFAFEKIDIKKVITEVYDDLKLSLDEKNINVKIDIDNPLKINANRSLLFSIFYNLFENAIKYGGKTSQINISNYLEDKNFQYFSFSNNGNSIDEKHLVRIFERFYRVDSGRSRKKGGTGLGLAIVKNAIQLHGGEISVGNIKSGGVEFIFSIAKK